MSKSENKQDRVCESASERTRLTYDDYRRLPENGPRYELVEGEYRFLPSPKVNPEAETIEVTVRQGDKWMSSHLYRGGATLASLLLPDFGLGVPALFAK